VKGIAIAVACALVAASAAALKIGGGTSAGIASPAPRSAVEPPISSPAAGAEGRVFLTQGQLKQALASGTIDRPIKSLLTVGQPLHFGDYRWNDARVPAGPVWIRIDLGPQLISVFRAGHEIGTAVIVYGGDNKETPVGKLHILGKARNHRSSLYDAEMPYTLRLTNDGVSIHGSRVEWGAATHGCIGVPLNFAERLFDASKVGDDVTIIPASQRRS
jgi:lipoprotein-anchoring transpeptidase ErfK/SrfK